MARILGIVTGVLYGLSVCGSAVACMVLPPPDPLYLTKTMVAAADTIVRVTALDHRNGSAREPVRFAVSETLKGSNVPQEILLSAQLTAQDEWNPGSVPYSNPRPSTLFCGNNQYRKGGQYLLFLRKSGNQYDDNWFKAAPTKEQVRSADDPWVRWAREQLQGKGVIEGRILDANGAPASGVAVAARTSATSGVLSGIAVTDNTGRYRIERLMPGDYAVIAAIAEKGFDFFGEWSTFFPDGRTFSSAQRLRVGPEKTLTANVDFQMLPYVYTQRLEPLSTGLRRVLAPAGIEDIVEQARILRMVVETLQGTTKTVVDLEAEE